MRTMTVRALAPAALAFALTFAACAPVTSTIAGPDEEPAPETVHTSIDASWAEAMERSRTARPLPYAGTRDRLAAARSMLIEHDLPPVAASAPGATDAEPPDRGDGDDGQATAPAATTAVARVAAPGAPVAEPIRTALDARSVRLNVGGGEVEVDGVLWSADMHVHTAGAVFSNTTLAEVANTAAHELYRSERNTGGDAPEARFDYAIPVDPGRYRVILHFAEIYFGTPGNPGAEPGQRLFDVVLQGEVVLVDYDVFAAAGGAATAVTESFVVDADGGVIDLVVRNGSANRGKLSALEVVPVGDGG
jgi:hypothetical protein